MEKKDYYSILGVDKNATPEQIKKCYRKLSMQWHPDRWATGTDEEKKKAEEKFKEIAEAYDVLSDPNKRNMYDNGGMEFDFGGGGIDPMEMFARMHEQFGDDIDGIFGNFFGGRGRGRRREERGRDIVVNLVLTTEEAYKGGEKEITLQKEVKCNHCNGTGSSDGKDTTCPHCKGQGVISKMQQMGRNSFSMVTAPCPHCNGTGKIITNPCKHCNGKGVEIKEVKEKINIPRGLSDGMTVNIPEMGSAPKNGNGRNGFLILNVTVIEDPYFYRPDEINVIHYEEVPFNECLLGFKKEFKCLDGSKVVVDSPELAPHGKSFIFKGKGMPNPNNERQFGDYAVVINYKLPTHLTKEQREKLKNF